MPKQYIETGRVVGTHGVKGELRIQPWSDSPDFLLDFDTLYLNDTGTDLIKVTASRVHKNLVLLKVDGVESIEDAERMRGKTVYINRNDVEMEDGRHFVQDLIGCAVSHADTGEDLGKISDVSATGANDVWHIMRDGREYLIPVIPDVVISVDIKAESVKIRPLEGIFDED